MKKKYIYPVLIILSGPLFILLVKFYSEMFQFIFNADNESANAYGCLTAFLSIAFAVMANVVWGDE